MINVTTRQLKEIFNRIVEKLEREGIDNVNIDEDYYWIILSGEWTDFDSNPSPAVGSLIDDWESLLRCLNGNAPFTYVDFDRTASILRAVSEKVNPSKES